MLAWLLSVWPLSVAYDRGLEDGRTVRPLSPLIRECMGCGAIEVKPGVWTKERTGVLCPKCKPGAVLAMRRIVDAWRSKRRCPRHG
jgi:hypothetical protein